MKRKLITLVLSLTLLTACEKENIQDDRTFVITEVMINSETYHKVEGIINENLEFTSDKKWLLSGGVFVDNGVSLVISNGQTIYADPNITTFLSIKQGGKIYAEGTSNNPIVFTPLKENATFGDWGGIIINGYAKLNTGLNAEGEGGTGIYGGNDDNDNSGVIRYVRVEFAGKILGTDNELNGFSFNGVGSGTVVEYIQAYKGSDDGIEFFGGTVNVKYAVSTENQDDSFDWTHGWKGKGQYWFAQQGVNGGDRGIEADNNADDNTLQPFSNPTLSNITLNGVDDGDGLNEGMRLREGTKGKIYNSLVTGFPKYGIRVTEQQTLDNVTSNELFLSNSSVINNGTDYNGADFSNNNSPLLDPWFIQDSNIGSGNQWMNGWVK